MVKRKKASKKRPTPKDQGLHAVSLILSRDLYDGLRLVAARQKEPHQAIVRRLLGDHLAAQGVVRPVIKDGKVAGYKFVG